ncbi:DEAD/DEAH box helicase [Marinoscillum furvescens]|uniref:Superfamily II DNA/RNA helicase n=1 Tax=Marinoscillum furvescens DSM 4134 TaxID=1122208 RepID=A0A3D9KYG0_MARFU|nr:DEAD/DEAH box helicase [Marinoscillum furvescens]RED93404.1 superfamily II DNA/RNA helicase [Marinoscillum furvescens DSM 4134]
MKFSELNLNPKLLEGIEAIGFENATPVQEATIPKILEAKDLIAAAQTGTGKTAAFLLPIIHKILEEPEDDNIKALIIVPTRELAVQIDQQLEGLSYYTSVSSLAVYGGGDGQSFDREKKALTEGADIIIGTPGRLIAHLNMKYVKVEKLKYLILDEADRMLDMGFNEDITKIIGYLPKERQTLLFSATMPTKIRALAKNILQDPEEINIAISKPNEKIVQAAFVVYDGQKIELVKHILKADWLRSVIVFCSTKDSAKRLTKELKKAELSVEEIHSDLDQKTREEVLSRFKSRKLTVLVATDILARGIDVEDIDIVINYDVPNDGEDYIHRIGRTARAASKGAAFTFVNEKEQSKFLVIEELLGKPVPKAKVPAHIGEGPAYNPKPMRRGGGGRRNGNGKGRRKK